MNIVSNVMVHNDLQYRVVFICKFTWPVFKGVAVRPGVGVTKAPFVNFSVSTILDLAKIPITFFESHSYLTGVAAAELRRHLSNRT